MIATVIRAEPKIVRKVMESPSRSAERIVQNTLSVVKINVQRTGLRYFIAVFLMTLHNTVGKMA